MPLDFSALAGILYCPDDGHALHCRQRNIDCPECGRTFRVFDNGVAELLPAKPADVAVGRSSRYWQAYRNAFLEPFSVSENAIAWGAAEMSSPQWTMKRLRQTRAVEALLAGDGSEDLALCDISAGPGYYTFAYSSRFRIVLHCDLSVDNLNYAARKARELELTNMFFLRTDYCAMPFRNSVDRILCLDTLIRGEDHEIAVLKSIRSSLAGNGSAVVDFHNWWHNPIRRLGALPDNFVGNQSYGVRETKQLLRSAGIKASEFIRFHQEFERNSAYGPVLSRLLPATRLLFRFEGGQTYEC